MYIYIYIYIYHLISSDTANSAETIYTKNSAYTAQSYMERVLRLIQLLMTPLH